MTNINSTKQPDNLNVNGSTAVSYNRNDTTARASDFRKMLFRVGFEKIEAQPLASALAETERLIKNQCTSNSENGQNDPQAALRTSWDNLETSLKSARLGVLNRIEFAILEFFGRFFSNAKEQAREFLLKQTRKERSDFLQCLATLADKSGQIPSHWETASDGDLAKARDLLLMGLAETMDMGRVLTDETRQNVNNAQFVEDILRKYQLADHADGLKSLLEAALDLLRPQANNDKSADNSESGQQSEIVRAGANEDSRHTAEQANGDTPDEGQHDETIDSNGDTENPDSVQESVLQNDMNIPGGDDAAGGQHDEAIDSNGNTENPDNVQESTKESVVNEFLNKVDIEQLSQKGQVEAAAQVSPESIDPRSLAENMKRTQAITWDLGCLGLGQYRYPKA